MFLTRNDRRDRQTSDNRGGRQTLRCGRRTALLAAVALGLAGGCQHTPTKEAADPAITVDGAMARRNWEPTPAYFANPNVVTLYTRFPYTFDTTKGYPPYRSYWLDTTAFVYQSLRLPFTYFFTPPFAKKLDNGGVNFGPTYVAVGAEPQEMGSANVPGGTGTGTGTEGAVGTPSGTGSGSDTSGGTGTGTPGGPGAAAPGVGSPGGVSASPGASPAAPGSAGTSGGPGNPVSPGATPGSPGSPESPANPGNPGASPGASPGSPGSTGNPAAGSGTGSGGGSGSSGGSSGGGSGGGK